VIRTLSKNRTCCFSCCKSGLFFGLFGSLEYLDKQAALAQRNELKAKVTQNITSNHALCYTPLNPIGQGKNQTNSKRVTQSDNILLDIE